MFEINIVVNPTFRRHWYLLFGWFFCRQRFSVQLHDMNVTRWHSIVKFTMPFDSLYSMVNDNIFRFQIHQIAKDLLWNWLQTHRDTFRMAPDTCMEIPYWFLDFWDLTLLISDTTEFSERRSERPMSITQSHRCIVIVSQNSLSKNAVSDLWNIFSASRKNLSDCEKWDIL
jgi:hypothetical protein